MLRFGPGLNLRTDLLLQLILLSGYPCSGKTHRSRQIIEYFEQRIAAASAETEPRIKRLKIQHLNDDNLGVARDVYATARAEKDARAHFASAIKRALAPDTVVVADGMNYIKGFRYQLYCEAKAVRTPHCVVHVGTPADRCRSLNDARAAAATTDSTKAGDTGGVEANVSSEPAPYAADVFENLVFRYEEPNGMTRWDAPLFTVPWEDEAPPCEAIWAALIGTDGSGAGPAVRPNAATVLKPAAEQDYLYTLDRTTSDVLARISTWVQDHAGEGGGAEVPVPEAAQPIRLPATVPSVAQLQRLRRQFIALNRQHSLSKARVRDLFVDYLNDAFEQ